MAGDASFAALQRCVGAANEKDGGACLYVRSGRCDEGAIVDDIGGCQEVRLMDGHHFVELHTTRVFCQGLRSHVYEMIWRHHASIG